MNRRRAVAPSLLELLVGTVVDAAFVTILQGSPLAGVRWIVHAVRWEARRRREGWPADRRWPW